MEELRKDLKYLNDKENKAFEKLLVITKTRTETGDVSDAESYTYLSRLYKLYVEITVAISKELRYEEESEQLRQDARELSKQLSEEQDENNDSPEEA